MCSTIENTAKMENATSPRQTPSIDERQKDIIEGCQSHAWLIMEASNGNISLRADSDTLIVRGILHLLINVLDRQTLYDIASAKLTFLDEAGLMTTFNASRRQGVGSIVSTIQQFARDRAQPIE